MEALCSKGADVNTLDANEGDCPLWQALDSAQTDIPSILVSHYFCLCLCSSNTYIRFECCQVQRGCDTDGWSDGPEGCLQTLLHRAIDENNEKSACFLIYRCGRKVPFHNTIAEIFTKHRYCSFSSCDVNARRKLGADGAGADVVSCQHTPLIMCASWGLSEVAGCLLEHRADANARDSDGKTSLHIAIENQQQQIVSMLLTQPDVDLLASDNNSVTAFGAALTTKNHKAAQAIVAREPQCAEQVRLQYSNNMK